MKILVLGVTGHIGSAVTRELLTRGHAVTGVARRPRARANLDGLSISYVRGDIDDFSADLNSWMRGHDAVVDAAAPYPVALPRDANAADLVRDATTRTQRLLRAARRHRAPIAYVSSFGTLPQRRIGLDRWATDLMQRLHPYFAVKSAIENMLLEAARDGQPVVVVNPTGCLGPWDLKPRERCFVPALLRGEMPAATNQMLNVIDVRDVAIGLVNALEAEVYGTPIALVGHNISNEILFRWICEIGNVKPPPFTAPSGAAVVATYLSEVALGAIGVEPPLPALIAMLTYIHGYLAPSAAQVDLGLVPRPLSRTLLETIEWYRAIGYC
ncbi:MAG TPA: NAD-dependent epimerase/dehydratase family protein [Candidatus Binataceae bacterium]|nr:NAD-dependent epimerase/dehydratase family protein [Candidatus Binataceae bacterium]